MNWGLLFLRCICFCCCIFSTTLLAQNTNNYDYRIQYEGLDWRYYPTKNFAIYIPQGCDSLAKEILYYGEVYKKEIEDSLQMQFQHKLHIIVYPSLAHKVQSNIGQFAERINAGGTFEFKGNRIVLEYKGSRTEFLQAFKLQLIEVLLVSQFYGNTIQEVLKNTIKQTVEPWFMEGVKLYAANHWDKKSDAIWKELILQPYEKTFNDLVVKNAPLAGHAFFHYLSQQASSSQVRRFIYEVRKSKNMLSSCKLVFKTPLWKMQESCLLFYVKRYLADNQQQTAFNSNKQIGTIAQKKKSQILTPSVQYDDENKILFYAETKGEGVGIYAKSIDNKNGEQLLFTVPYANEQGVSYPLLYFSKKKPYQIGVVFNSKGKTHLNVINFSKQLKKVKEQIHDLSPLDGITSIKESYREHTLVIAGYKNGQSDIYEYNLIKKDIAQITNTYSDELLPTSITIGDNQGYVFISNNETDTFFHRLVDGNKLDYYRMFFINDKNFAEIRKHNITYFSASLPNPTKANISDIVQGSNNAIYLVSDANGINNFYVTSIVNGKFTDMRQLTNSPFQYSSNQLIANDTFCTSTKLDDSITLLKVAKVDSISPYLTVFAQDELIRNRREQEAKDSIANRKKNQEHSILTPFKASAEQIQAFKDSVSKERQYKSEKLKPYKLSLTSEYVSAQLDNTLLINRYQPYHQNQGQFHQQQIGGMAKYTFSDLFEDYKASIGFRIPSNTKGSDFFIEWDNYKKRLDWGLSYFRHVEKFTIPNDTNWYNQQGYFPPNYVKQKTHYLELRMQYPFSPKKAIKASVGIRKDRQVFIATDTYSLTYPDTSQVWMHTRVEWMYHKFHKLEVQERIGFSTKLFIEYQNELGGGKGSFVQLGANAQYTMSLYKKILWANRLQAAISGGETEGMMYVLGGVQNQLAPLVDSTVNFSQKDNYSFISYASNLRGYAQNIRYGNSMVLYNTEIRMPILPMFFNQTTKFNSLNKLQLITFLDVGNAWKLSTTIPKWAMGYGVGIRTELVSYYIRLDCAWRNLSQQNMKHPMIHIAIGREW